MKTNREIDNNSTKAITEKRESAALNVDIISLLDTVKIATLFLDVDLRVTQFTQEIQRIFNLEDIDVGKKFSSIKSNFPPSTVVRINANARIVLENSETIEDQIIDLKGNYYLLRVSPFVKNDESIEGVIITMNNISLIKEVEAKLDKVNLNYTNLFHSLNAGFIHAKIITDKNNTPIDCEYIDVNQAYSDIHGIQRDKLIGERISKILPNLINDPNQWIQKFSITALEGKNQIISGYISTINKYFEVNTFSPKIGEFACIIFDLTERKNNENKLARYARELDNIQRLTCVGSWSLDLTNGNVTWSEELYHIFKLDKNKAAPNYKRQSQLFTPDSWKILSKAVSDAKAKGTSYELELEMIKANGETGWLLGKGEAVIENGKIIGLRGAAQDITERKLNEVALINAKKKAKDEALANLQKNYFLANMSHEIRTPISSVLGFADLLKEDTLKKHERLKYLEIIDSNSKQILNLVNDIIDISTIESGKLELHYDECDIELLFTNLTLTFEQIKLQRDKPNLKLKPVVSQRTKGLKLKTDVRRLKQILINLIENAIKFSNRGTISYGYETQGDLIKFFVKDEGIGIIKSKQEQIFDSFKQLNYQNKENYGGTGLGLAICKALVTMLGGTITVKSQFYRGSTFEFTLPYQVTNSTCSPEKKSPIEKGEFLKNKSILIAEDNKLIRLLLERILMTTGATIEFAKNGKEAVDYFIKNPHVDLVLLDIRMPKMSGIEALDEILKINPKAKIIMQTAHAMEEEKELCFEKGCIDFISKPIIKKELYRKLNKWVHDTHKTFP